MKALWWQGVQHKIVDNVRVSCNKCIAAVEQVDDFVIDLMARKGERQVVIWRFPVNLLNRSGSTTRIYHVHVQSLLHYDVLRLVGELETIAADGVFEYHIADFRRQLKKSCGRSLGEGPGQAAVSFSRWRRVWSLSTRPFPRPSFRPPKVVLNIDGAGAAHRQQDDVGDRPKSIQDIEMCHFVQLISQRHLVENERKWGTKVNQIARHGMPDCLAKT